MAVGFEAELEALRASGRFREPVVIERLAGGRGRIDGREAVVLCSNDYLGLSQSPELSRAAAAGAVEAGSGAGASRLISGSFPIHVQTEARLAEFVGAQAALLFPSGYQANVGAISALVGRDDVICSDELNHASIIDGCRLSRAEIRIYPHRDLDALERLLRVRPTRGRSWIVTESLFSMDGDEPDLRAIAELARRHDSGLLVDEAHALGVFGAGGRGLCAEAGIAPDLLVGTLGKAFGCAGAFVSGSRAAIELVANRARSFVFTTAAAPAVAAAALRAITLVESGHERRERLFALVRQARATLASSGIEVGPGRGPILPIVIGDDRRTMRIAQRLLDWGYFIHGIRPPTVPEGTSRLRMTLCSEHASADVARACAAVAEAVSVIGTP